MVHPTYPDSPCLSALSCHLRQPCCVRRLELQSLEYACCMMFSSCLGQKCLGNKGFVTFALNQLGFYSLFVNSKQLKLNRWLLKRTGYTRYIVSQILKGDIFVLCCALNQAALLVEQTPVHKGGWDSFSQLPPLHVYLFPLTLLANQRSNALKFSDKNCQQLLQIFKARNINSKTHNVCSLWYNNFKGR